MVVHCAKCNHEWDTLLRLPMLLDDFCHRAKGVSMAGCPACGACGKDDVLCGHAPKPKAGEPQFVAH